MFIISRSYNTLSFKQGKAQPFYIGEQVPYSWLEGELSNNELHLAGLMNSTCA